MKRSTVALGVLGFLFVTLLWWTFVIGPQNSDVDTANQELQTEEDRAFILHTRLAQLREIKANEVSYQFAIGAMQSSIPVEPAHATFISDINQLAASTGVRISQISLAPPAQTALEVETPVFEVAVSLSVTGQYFEVLGFLYGIEAMDRLVRTDTISLSPGATQDSGDADVDGVPDVPVNQRAEISELNAELSLRLFTRTGVLVVVEEPAAGENSGDAPPEDDVGE